MKHISQILLSIVLVGMLFSSCEKEKSQYQVRIQNEMYSEFLGFPFMKYDIKEITLGGLDYSDVYYGQYSEYQNIESSTDYEINITIDVYLYDIDNYVWVYDRTNTYDLGTVTWVDDEDYVNHKLKFEIGTIMDLYEPVFTKYAEE